MQSSSSAFSSCQAESCDTALESLSHLLESEQRIFALDEKRQRHLHPHRHRHPHALPQWMRLEVLQWIREVVDEYDLSELTMWTASLNFDRFVRMVPLPRRCIQLAAAVSILIASKLHDITPPSLRAIAAVTENVYSIQHIKDAEKHFLNVLGYGDHRH